MDSGYLQEQNLWLEIYDHERYELLRNREAVDMNESDFPMANVVAYIQNH